MVSESEAEEDAALLAAYARGDIAAARILTERHAGRCLALARRMLGDPAEAEDVAQEAMLRLWRIAPQWRAGEARVSTWLWRVTANLCTDRLRRRRGRMVDIDSVPEPADGRPSAQARLESEERRAAVLAAIAALPDRQRQAIEMRHLDGLSNIEIAEIMDVSVEAVESLLGRGRRRLAVALADLREGMGLS
ncbi:MAG: RNA polymerase sigma factor [Alphaproteobacteria bacterium]|nr:MAG: RNA polymerase sigma factor [Alphaproteobacteria bacterium]